MTNIKIAKNIFNTYAVRKLFFRREMYFGKCLQILPCYNGRAKSLLTNYRSKSCIYYTRGDIFFDIPDHFNQEYVETGTGVHLVMKNLPWIMTFIKLMRIKRNILVPYYVLIQYKISVYWVAVICVLYWEIYHLDYIRYHTTMCNILTRISYSN